MAPFALRLVLALALVGLVAVPVAAAPSRARSSAPQGRAAGSSRAKQTSGRSTVRKPARSAGSRSKAAPTSNVAPSSPKTAPEPPAAERGRGTAEAKVENGTPAPAASVVKTEEAAQGVKTYTFDAHQVEGRLKSPQILYFLRRVRAEFDTQPLGHRSFLLELSDTRRHPALR